MIKWVDSFSVNVKEIDEQHKRLIGIINELKYSIINENQDDTIEKILDNLTNYTITHFKLEEDYFDKLNYPLAESHKKEHAYFIEKINDFKKEFKVKKVMLSIDILNFLMNWLIKHINDSDKNYSDFFNKHGIT